ncbi:hypothetical protein BSKO_06845 [Bryopsis sp. KO-2023]|nr:hypothetical protein BSKO_06845 [Bryopsis sp. KO-2023]
MATTSGGGESGSSNLRLVRKSPILPYGDTLHYQGCGCPTSWQSGSRMCDLVDVIFQHCHSLFVNKMLPPVRPLRVVYMLPHHNITGGMKCLVEHIRLLRERGHTTIAVHRSDTAKSAMPPWTDVKPDTDVVCSLQQRLNDVYPVEQIDVVVVGIFHQVAELLVGVPAPVVYWEQGHEWVFGDPVRFQTAQNYLKQDQLFHMVMHLPVPLAVVSKAVQDILYQDFGRTSVVVPNGIDCNRFFPGERATPPTVKFITDGVQVCATVAKSVLLVGNPALPLKGFDIALSVLTAVNKVLPIAVTWVCQVKPTVAMLPILGVCDLDITYHVSPPQNEIPKLYRGHDVFLFTSRYEAWGMPVMEAMASGVPVVTTDCLGVRTFGDHGVNCLMGDVSDINALSQYVVRALTDENAKAVLSKAGRETALKFGPANVVETLEALLYSLTACSQELLKARQSSVEELQVACQWAAEACSRPAQPRRG